MNRLENALLLTNSRNPVLYPVAVVLSVDFLRHENGGRVDARTLQRRFILQLAENELLRVKPGKMLLGKCCLQARQIFLLILRFMKK